MRRSDRVIAIVAVAVGLVAFVVGSAARQADCPADCRVDQWLPTALRTVLVVAAALFAIVVGLQLLLPRLTSLRFAGGTAALAVSCLGVGLLAAAPVYTEWDDGCNDQGAHVSLIELPRVEIQRPERALTAYDEISTLVLCGSRDA